MEEVIKTALGVVFDKAGIVATLGWLMAIYFGFRYEQALRRREKDLEAWKAQAEQRTQTLLDWTVTVNEVKSVIAAVGGGVTSLLEIKPQLMRLIDKVTR